MGNILNKTIVNYDNIKFVSYTFDQKYFYEISIEEFNIEVIKEKLILLNDNQVNDSLDNIIIVLEYIKQIETKEILEQVDGFLFEKHSNLPFLQIKNINAIKARRANNIKTDGFYYKCNLTKTFTYKIFF